MEEVEKKKETLEINAAKCFEIPTCYQLSTVEPSTTSKKPSQSQRIAVASTGLGEVQEEGQQSQQEN